LSFLAPPSSGPAQARRLEDMPFPFPFGQMLSFMLVCFGSLYPLVVSIWVRGSAVNTPS
jgi:hypothetical protein